jgi:hypothetical protein
VSRYRVRYTTHIALAVEIEAPCEDAATDAAWQPAEEYLLTLRGDGHSVVSVNATLDGIGAEEVAEIQEEG